MELRAHLVTLPPGKREKAAGTRKCCGIRSTRTFALQRRSVISFTERHTSPKRDLDQALLQTQIFYPGRPSRPLHSELVHVPATQALAPRAHGAASENPLEKLEGHLLLSGSTERRGQAKRERIGNLTKKLPSFGHAKASDRSCGSSSQAARGDEINRRLAPPCSMLDQDPARGARGVQQVRNATQQQQTLSPTTWTTS